jgi:transposase
MAPPAGDLRCSHHLLQSLVRWRRTGVWDQIMNALAAGHDAAVQMIDTSVVRVHQHGACIADNNPQDMGRSRGGLTSKIHAVVDSNGLPVNLALTPGEAHDNRLCSILLSALLPQTMLLADRGYDADWDQGACPPARSMGEHSAETQSQRPESASAHICIVRATWLNGSSAKSSNVGQLSGLSSSHRSAFGCVLMSPHPPQSN